jgi:A/G-specific adenine glycosylase
VLIGQRPTRGLLGGMAEVPGTDWTAAMPAAPDAPLALPFTRLAGDVTHVFTHFPLTLAVYRAEAPTGTPAPDGLRWVNRAHLEGEALAQVFRKVLAHAFDETVQRGPARMMREL